MTKGEAFVVKLKEMAALAAELPKGAEVTVEWWDAPPDLVLAVWLLRGARMRSVKFVGGGKMERAEWRYKGMMVRAHQCTVRGAGNERVQLRLVKP